MARVAGSRNTAAVTTTTRSAASATNLVERAKWSVEVVLHKWNKEHQFLPAVPADQGKSSVALLILWGRKPCPSRTVDLFWRLYKAIEECRVSGHRAVYMADLRHTLGGVPRLSGWWAVYENLERLPCGAGASTLLLFCSPHFVSHSSKDFMENYFPPSVHSHTFFLYPYP